MNKRIRIHKRGIDSRIKNLAKWKIPEQSKKSLLKFLEELGLGKVNKGMKISESRQSKYLDVLKIPLEFWNKPENKLTMKDVDAFEEYHKKLEKDAIDPKSSSYVKEDSARYYIMEDKDEYF